MYGDAKVKEVDSWWLILGIILTRLLSNTQILRKALFLGMSEAGSMRGWISAQRKIYPHPVWEDTIKLTQESLERAKVKRKGKFTFFWSWSSQLFLLLKSESQVLGPPNSQSWTSRPPIFQAFGLGLFYLRLSRSSGLQTWTELCHWPTQFSILQLTHHGTS